MAEEKGYFLRVYERREKFRFMIKKSVSGKNTVQRDLSACIIQKFNGYKISSQKLKREQKRLLEPIDIVYEPVRENEDIICYFASDLALAHRTYYSRMVRGKDVISNLGARQCYYCDHFFIRKSVLEKHVKSCCSIAGIAYKFNNRKVVSFNFLIKLP